MKSHSSIRSERLRTVFEWTFQIVLCASGSIHIINSLAFVLSHFLEHFEYIYTQQFLLRPVGPPITIISLYVF